MKSKVSQLEEAQCREARARPTRAGAGDKQKMLQVGRSNKQHFRDGTKHAQTWKSQARNSSHCADGEQKADKPKPNIKGTESAQKKKWPTSIDFRQSKEIWTRIAPATAKNWYHRGRRNLPTSNSEETLRGIDAVTKRWNKSRRWPTDAEISAARSSSDSLAAFNNIGEEPRGD